MLDRYVGRAIEAHGPGYSLGEVRKELGKADLVVANLECPLTTQPKLLVKHFPFRVPTSRAAALEGIDLVSIANNHTLDCGRPGLAQTVRTLRKKHIEPIGEEGWKAVVVNRNGLRIAFFAFSDFPETVSGIGPAVSYYDKDKMREALLAVRKKVDDVVVFAHWGVEGESQPSERQRKEAKELAAAGADLILGSHPHVLQPVEKIGRTIVAYSMGNFVFDSVKPNEARTAIFRFKLTRAGASALAPVPCQISHTRPVISRPRPPRPPLDRRHPTGARSSGRS